MTDSRKREHKRCSSSKSSSSSSSSSSSKSSYEDIVQIRKFHKKHRSKSISPKRCSSEHYSNEKKSSKSSSSSSSSDCRKRYNFCDIYQYFKNRLLEDKGLMVAGSDGYIYATSLVSEMIPPAHHAIMNNIVENRNIEIVHLDSPFFVRTDGIYIIFFTASTDNTCQFTMFVNGELRETTCVGTNSGAGQVLNRQTLALKKDDEVVIRNYISPNTVKTTLYHGGTNPGNDKTWLMVKIAPLNPADVCEKECDELHKYLTHKKKKLFKKLTEKLLFDKELMVKGFDIVGTFYNTVQQTVPLEADVQFSALNNVNGFVWNPTGSNPEQIQVLEDGVYKLFFLANTNAAAQFAFCVNGVPNENTTEGTNRGAGQFNMRVLLKLNKNDILTVRNHSSANGTLTISEYAGGTLQNINSMLNIFKVAPLNQTLPQPVDCKVAKRFECYYEKFRTYLLCKDYLQINGSGAYLSTSSSVHQLMPLNSSFHWNANGLVRNAYHQQGGQDIVVKKSGLYDVFADIITDEPMQMTLFVNNVPNLSTVFGRDSGANRTLLRQVVELNKGDVINIRNYSSSGGDINTAVNPGGSFVSRNTSFLFFLMTPTCVPPPPCPPCPPSPPHPPTSPKRHSSKSDCERRRHRKRKSKRSSKSSSSSSSSERRCRR